MKLSMRAETICNLTYVSLSILFLVNQSNCN